MPEKRDVLDYLRNQQKAAEIEAKVNGINLWVLLGAMAVVGWQLMSSFGGDLWQKHELVLRTLLAAEALFLLSWLAKNSGSVGEEIRYSRSGMDEMESPFLVLLQGLLLLIPPLMFIVVVGKTFGSIALCLMGVAFVGFSARSILRSAFSVPVKQEKFPKPDFGLTKRADVIGDLVFGAIFVVSIVEQGAFLQSAMSGLSADDAKQLVLMGALYLLVGFAVRRKLHSDSTAWTYELETEVVLEAVTPDVAIRRIEHRRLGPRLQDVMDRFFDDLDRRFAVLDTRVEDCRQKLLAAKEVPDQYPAERAARVKEATDSVSSDIESLVSDCGEFRTYLSRLEEKRKGGRMAVLAPVLTSLKSRHESYDERARSAKLEMRRMLE